MKKLLMSICLLAIAPAIYADVGLVTDKSVYVYVHGGEFRPEQNKGKIDPANGWYVDIGAGADLNRYVSFQGGLWTGIYDAERVGGVLPGTSSSDLTLVTTGVVGSGLLQLPLGWFRPYIGAGAGYYYTGIEAEACFVVCEDTTTSGWQWGTQLLAGAMFDISPDAALILSWQRLSLENNFGIYTNGDIKLGGETIGLGINFRY